MRKLPDGKRTAVNNKTHNLAKTYVFIKNHYFGSCFMQFTKSTFSMSVHAIFGYITFVLELPTPFKGHGASVKS